MTDKEKSEPPAASTSEKVTLQTTDKEKSKQPRVLYTARDTPGSVTLYYLPAFFSSCVSDPNADLRRRINPIINIWVKHPAEFGYDPSKAIAIDLDQTPSKLGLENPERIVTDDHAHRGGYTTMGPCFPQAYGSGGIYLSSAMREKVLTNGKHGAPPPEVDETLFIKQVTSSTEDRRPQGEMSIPPRRPPRSLDRPRPPLVRYHGYYGLQLCRSKYPNLWIVWHPGTWSSRYVPGGTGKQWRPPRKLWVPDAVMPHPAPKVRVGARGSSGTKAQTKAMAGQIQPVFLEQDFALYVADLDIPKQPSGSGEGSPYIKRSANKIRPLSPPNLSVVSEYAPGEMSQIKKQLKNYLELGEGETLVDGLSRYVAYLVESSLPVPKFKNLDLIGHSRSRDRVLKLGELAFTARTAKSQFTQLYEQDVLDFLGIESIRLLGCRTAAPPRGQHVVKTIRECTELSVYATRTDLFAVHYNENGLCEQAEALLADDEVITHAGAGDLPPHDDYPADLPEDDDDANDDPVIPGIPTPAAFSLSELSDVNAATVSADQYLFWDWEPEQLEHLCGMLHFHWAERDNPLLRAECEVLLASTTTPHGLDEFRSFDLFLEDRPRLRINRGGCSFSFRFRNHKDLRNRLSKIGIDIE